MGLFDKRDNVPNMKVINSCSSMEELQDYFDQNNLQDYNIQDFISADIIILDNSTHINIDNSSTIIDNSNIHHYGCCNSGQGDDYEEDDDYYDEDDYDNETIAIEDNTKTQQINDSFGFGSFLWGVTKGTAYIASLGTIWVAKELLWKPTHKVVSSNLDRLEDKLHQGDNNTLALDNPDIIDVEIYPKARQIA